SSMIHPGVIQGRMSMFSSVAGQAISTVSASTASSRLPRTKPSAAARRGDGAPRRLEGWNTGTGPQHASRKDVGDVAHRGLALPSNQEINHDFTRVSRNVVDCNIFAEVVLQLLQQRQRVMVVA